MALPRGSTPIYYPPLCEGGPDIYPGSDEAWLRHRGGKLIGKLPLCFGMETWHSNKSSYVSLFETQ